MPPKLGTLSKKTLLERLAECSNPGACTECSRQELLDRAHKLNLVSAFEYERTTEVELVTRKRYLQTMVKDDAFLAAIDRYVIAASLVRSAGSHLANLFAIRAYEAGCFNNPTFLDATLKDTTFVKYCLMPFKAALPQPGVSMRDAMDPPHSVLADVWRANLHHFEKLYPPMDDLRFMSWDQALTDMAREYQGALTAHVMTHLHSRMQRLFEHRLASELGCFKRKDSALGRFVMTFTDGTACFASDAYAALQKGPEPGMRLPTAVQALVLELRERCGLAGNARLDRLSTLTSQLFTQHMQLSEEAVGREDTSWYACPIIKTDRTFAYIDERVVRQLLATCGNRINGLTYEERPDEDRDVSLLAWAFGAHRRAWLAANKAARRQHRKAVRGRSQKSACGIGAWPGGPRAPRTPKSCTRDAKALRRNRRARRRRHNKAKRLRQHRGDPKQNSARPSSLKSRDARCRSVSTDGVALCVLLEVEPVLSQAKRKELSRITEPERLRQFLASLSPEELQELVKMAEDPGRVNLSQVLVKRCLGDVAEPGAAAAEAQERLTRASYLKRSLRARYQQAEKMRRHQDRLLRVGIDLLGSGGFTWRTTRHADYQRMLQRQTVVQDILAAEYVYSTWYARWKMLLWRRRQSVLAQYYAGIIKKHAPKGAPVVLGRGDAGFASMGRGETSVPTTGVAKAAQKALGSLRTRNPKSCMSSLDEMRTTLTCHRCGSVLRDVLDDQGRALRGLKECRGCHAHLNGQGVDTWCRLERVRPARNCAPAPAEASRRVVERRSVLDDKGNALKTLELCVVRGQRTQEHTSRIFNRDINATKNLMLVLEALLRGQPRPAHLRKQTRQRQPAPAQERGEEVEDDFQGRDAIGGFERVLIAHL